MQMRFNKTQLKTSIIALGAVGGMFPAFILQAYAAQISQPGKENLQTTALPKGIPGSPTGNSSAQGNPAVPPIPASENTVTSSSAESSSVQFKSQQTDLKAGSATSPAPSANVTTKIQAKPEGLISAQENSAPAQNPPTTGLAPVPTLISNTAEQGLNSQQKTEPDVKTDSKAGSPATTATTDAGTGSQAAVVPNGAALQTQLLPLGQGETSPWSTLVAGGCLIFGIAAAGVMAVRLKQGRGQSAGRSEKQLQLVTSMALSPKRQILLVRVRDREVALASTEHGISLLTELSAPNRTNMTLLDDGGNEEPKKRKVQQRIQQEDPVKLVASAESAGEETALARSEMLMGALKNLREKNLRNKQTNGEELQTSVSSSASSSPSAGSEKIERKLTENPVGETQKRESTLKQTRAAFPKYLANAFEQESKRTLPQNQQQSTQDDAGSVTNMIRERLKELRPLS